MNTWHVQRLQDHNYLWTCLSGEKSTIDLVLICYTAAAKGTLIIVCSTVAPAYIQNLEKRLTGTYPCRLCWLQFSEVQVDSLHRSKDCSLYNNFKVHYVHRHWIHLVLLLSQWGNLLRCWPSTTSHILMWWVSKEACVCFFLRVRSFVVGCTYIWRSGESSGWNFDGWFSFSKSISSTRTQFCDRSFCFIPNCFFQFSCLRYPEIVQIMAAGSDHALEMARPVLSGIRTSSVIK